jgi:hypothetical protein
MGNQHLLNEAVTASSNSTASTESSHPLTILRIFVLILIVVYICKINSTPNWCSKLIFHAGKSDYSQEKFILLLFE